MTILAHYVISDIFFDMTLSRHRYVARYLHGVHFIIIYRSCPVGVVLDGWPFWCTSYIHNCSDI